MKKNLNKSFRIAKTAASSHLYTSLQHNKQNCIPDLGFDVDAIISVFAEINSVKIEKKSSIRTARGHLKATMACNITFCGSTDFELHNTTVALNTPYIIQAVQ